MKYRLKIIGLADGRATPADDTWLVDCDFEASGGRGMVLTTKIPSNAMKFDTSSAAMMFWKKRSKTVPNRPDGKPNRPLTAYTVEVEKILV